MPSHPPLPPVASGQALAQMIAALIARLRTGAGRNLVTAEQAIAGEAARTARQAYIDRLNAFALQLEGQAGLQLPGTEKASFAQAELAQLQSSWQPTMSSLPQPRTPDFVGRLAQVGR